MRRNLIKTAVVSVLALTFTVIPATQAFACCGGYGYGYGYRGGDYYPPVTQQRYTSTPQTYTVPQTYTAPQTTQTRVQSNTNNFDPTVFDIQVVLFEQGYYGGELDGLYGPATKTALLQFQGDNGIEKTAGADILALKADQTTLEALGL